MDSRGRGGGRKEEGAEGREGAARGKERGDRRGEREGVRRWKMISPNQIIFNTPPKTIS